MSKDSTAEIFISWAQVHKDSKRLAMQVEHEKDWKGIIAVTRGGMVPACLVARVLDIKTIDTFCITSYSYQDQGQADIRKNLALPDGGDGWLVVDDMVDTGGTFQIMRQSLPKATYAVLYAKPQGKPDTDFYVQDYKQSDWLHCPWECDGETGAPQGY